MSIGSSLSSTMGAGMTGIARASANAKEAKRKYEISLSSSERKQYEEFKHKKLVRIYTCKYCGRVWLVTYKQMWGKLGVHWLWCLPLIITIIGAIPVSIVMTKWGKKSRMACEKVCLKCQSGMTYRYITKEKAKEIKKLIKLGKKDQLNLIKGRY